MATTVPRYQFVRFNEDITLSECFQQQFNGCLPVNELSDLKFQLITDFKDNDDDDLGLITRLVVVPCDACGDLDDSDVFAMAFGEEAIAVTGTTDNNGNLRVGMDSHFNDIAAGDFVELTAACTAGAHDYAGIYEVLAVDVVGGGGGTQRVTLNTPYEGVIVDDCDGGVAVGDVILRKFPRTSYLSSFESIQLDDDVEFAGENYLWNIDLLNDGPELNYTQGQCFRLCVYRVIAFSGQPAPEMSLVECLGTTNCFQKENNLCYTTKLTYGCNEDAFGFYTDGTNPFEVSLRMRFYLSRPKFPGEEKGYQQSTGSFSKLAERVNKTYELRTDNLTDELHERLRIALSCDTISVTNEYSNLSDVEIYKQEEYTPEWDDTLNLPFCKGKATVFKRLLSRSVNSNCND